MNSKTRKILLILLGLIIITILFGVFWRVPQAGANPSKANSFATGLSTFWNDLLHPFSHSSATSPADASSSSALYSPDDSYETDVINAVKEASPAVVSITISENVPIVENCPTDPFSDVPSDLQQLFGSDFPSQQTQCDTGKTQLQAVGGGSGFIISSNGLILTNKHVVSDTDASYSVLTNDGNTYTAKVLARDPNQDLAVLKIDATNLPTLTFADSDGLQLGQTAIAIGNALGQFSNTVSVGVVSGLSRTVTATAPDTGAEETIQGVIQTDAAINPGNSGGPLLNLKGQVIGIDTAVASDAQNIGFAIPINEAKSAIASVEATGQIEAPFLGVRYEQVTPTLATQDKLVISYGALVSGGGEGAAVQAGSPAAQAGIKANDIIESVDGQVLDSTHDLADIINEHSVGDTVTLVIDRAGQQITLQVTLAERPSSS
jgi:serine protease Do